MATLIQREALRVRVRARGAPRRRLVVLLVLVLAAGGEASDRVLIPSASEPWRTRLKQALADIRDGRIEAGLDVLQKALTDRAGTLYELRDEELLRAPLEVEIEDSVLVTEKSQAPRFPSLRGGPVLLPERAVGGEDVGNQPRRFLPLASVAHLILRKLPGPVREEYRARYDESALDLLESYRTTGDEEFLAVLVEDYFFSSHGTEAAEALADLHWEAGRWIAALGIWTQIALDDDVSTRPGPRTRAGIKLVRGLRRLGRHVEADAGAAELLRKLEKEPGSIPGGQDPAILLSSLATSRPPSREDRDATGFPARRAPSRWGGELTMGALPEVSEGRLTFSWDSWIWMPKPVSLVGSPFTLLVDGDSLFVSGPHRVYRLDARPGRGSILEDYVKPGTELRYPEDNETLQYTVTLWKKRLESRELLADLPEEILVTNFIADLVRFDHYLGYEINAEVPIRGLIAFDGKSSQPLWSVSEEPLRDPASPENRREGMGRIPPRGRITKAGGRSAGEKGLSYNSPALVKQGLVIVGGWVQRGYVNTVLRAHDLRDGALVWETLISSGQLEQTMFGELAREPFPGAICEEGGVVYYCTQQGAVAAVDLETGRLAWLMTYETIPIETTFGRQARKRLISWGPNSMLIKDNLLIVTPRDSQYLYAIDVGRGPEGEAGAGRILWKYQNRSGELRDFLGYLDGYLYFSGHGSGAVLRLDIRHLDRFGRLAVAQGLGPQETDPEGSRPEGAGAVGNRAPGVPPSGVPTRSTPRLERSVLRLGIGSSIPPGALTPRGVVIADGGRLKLVAPDLQEIRDISMPFRELSGRTVPGRVQVVDGMVFITSKNLISAYAPENVD